MPDRLAEPEAADRVVGVDEPSGDPELVVPLVVEELTGQVGPPERPVEPVGEGIRERLQRRRISRSVVHEEDVSRFDQPPGRGIEFEAEGLCAVLDDMAAPEADDGDSSNRVIT